jgi:hypothetical protein
MSRQFYFISEKGVQCSSYDQMFRVVMSLKDDDDINARDLVKYMKDNNILLIRVEVEEGTVGQ